jgi:hypothetical protein
VLVTFGGSARPEALVAAINDWWHAAASYFPAGAEFDLECFRREMVGKMIDPRKLELLARGWA